MATRLITVSPTESLDHRLRHRVSRGASRCLAPAERAQHDVAQHVGHSVEVDRHHAHTRQQIDRRPQRCDDLGERRDPAEPSRRSPTRQRRSPRSPRQWSVRRTRLRPWSTTCWRARVCSRRRRYTSRTAQPPTSTTLRQVHPTCWRWQRQRCLRPRPVRPTPLRILGTTARRRGGLGESYAGALRSGRRRDGTAHPVDEP